MKILLILIFGLIIIVKSGGELPVCNLATAKQALPPVIFAETTIDGSNQPVLVTRFLHNKIGIYTSQFARCYFNALDLNFINHAIGIIGLISLLFFLFRATVKKYYAPLIVFLGFPILPFFNAPLFALIFAYKIFAIIGLVFLLKNR